MLISLFGSIWVYSGRRSFGALLSPISCSFSLQLFCRLVLLRFFIYLNQFIFFVSRQPHECILKGVVKEMFRLQALSEKLESRVHCLLASLALNPIEAKYSKLFVAVLVWTFQEPIYILTVGYPVQSLREEMLASVVSFVRLQNSAT